MQFPQRKETNQEARIREQKIKDRNEAQGCDANGRPVDKAGNLLKNIGKDDPYRV